MPFRPVQIDTCAVKSSHSRPSLKHPLDSGSRLQDPRTQHSTRNRPTFIHIQYNTPRQLSHKDFIFVDRPVHLYTTSLTGVFPPIVVHRRFVKWSGVPRWQRTLRRLVPNACPWNSPLRYMTHSAYCVQNGNMFFTRSSSSAIWSIANMLGCTRVHDSVFWYLPRDTLVQVFRFDIVCLVKQQADCEFFFIAEALDGR